MNREKENLINKKLDSELSAKELEQFNLLLNNDPKFKTEYLKSIKLRKDIVSTRRESFKPFFEQRVIAKINTQFNSNSIEDLFFEVLFSQFKRIVIPAMLVLVMILTYKISSISTVNLNTITGIPDVTISDTVDPLNYLVSE